MKNSHVHPTFRTILNSVAPHVDVVEKLIIAAKRWAAFQEGDSLEDQRTDVKLQAEAIEAREALLKIIEEQL